jgi:ribosome-associated protein
MQDVPIRDQVIRLGQFLKLANLIEHGADAKAVVQQGLVSVNGEVETRRGRQLSVGDVATLAGMSARVVAGSDEPTDDLPW